MAQKPPDTIVRSIESGTKPGDRNLLVFDRPDEVKGRSLEANASRMALAEHKLGDIMVTIGLLTPEAKERVLDRQAKTGRSFGECAVRMKLITARELEHALSAQFAFQPPVLDQRTLTKDLVMAREPFGTYGESMRAIANRLISQWGPVKHHALAITSSSPGEGRSHVAANLAMAFAQYGWRTLLIDADMRNPRQHQIFGVSQHPGLSRLLCTHAPEDVVRPVPFLDNLSVITAGPTPPNVVELLSRDELRTLLRHARESFDIVIVDTPSGDTFVDAEIIAKAVGSALIVATQNHTRMKSIRTFKEDLDNRGVQTVGVLLNTP